MEKGNWIAIDKRMLYLLPKDKPYTIIEAMISVSYDIDQNKRGTISGYAKLWGWSRHKVRSFINELMAGKDYYAHKKGTSTGHPIRLIFKNKQGNRDILRTIGGHPADTTINLDNTTYNKKKQGSVRYTATHRPVSFEEFVKNSQIGSKDKEAALSIAYFIDVYKHTMRDEHPKLKPDQWKNLFNTILTVVTDDDVIDIEYEDITKMIDQYFSVKFQEGCNYSIMHFNSNNVKNKRYWETTSFNRRYGVNGGMNG